MLLRHNGGMNEDMNPTLPLAFDLAWMASIIVWLAFTVAAVVSILRQDHDRIGGKFWWSALVITVPLFGAVIWFLSARRTNSET